MLARQKAAESARERAAAAVDRLKGCMTDLVQQYSCDLLASSSALLLEAPSSQQYGEQYGAMMMAGGAKGAIDGLAWSHMESESVSLLEGNPFGGAADNGAALIHMDFGFGSSMIKVRN